MDRQYTAPGQKKLLATEATERENGGIA